MVIANFAKISVSFFVFILVVSVILAAHGENVAPAKQRHARQKEGCFTVTDQNKKLGKNQQSTLICDFRVKDDFPLYSFRLVLDKHPDSDYIGSIIITSESKKNGFHQIIQLPSKGLYYPDSRRNYGPHYKYFLLEDMNFDGYRDIRILMDYPCGNMGCQFYFLLFDPKTRKFVFNESLSALLDPEVNKNKRTITSFSNGGSGEYFYQTFQFNSNKLVLIMEENQTWSEGRGYVKKTSKLINGKMVLVKTEPIEFGQYVP